MPSRLNLPPSSRKASRTFIAEDDLAYDLAEDVRECLAASLGDFELGHPVVLNFLWSEMGADYDPDVAERLLRWTYLDRMEGMIDDLMYVIRMQPDISAQEIMRIIQVRQNRGPRLSREQQQIIKIAAQRYETSRRQVRTYREGSLGLKPAALFLDGRDDYPRVERFLTDIGMKGKLNVRNVGVDFSHPLVSMVEVGNADMVRARLSNAEQNEYELSPSRAGRVTGFHHNGREVITPLSGTVCFVKSTLSAAEKGITVDHETMHALFALLLDSNKYDLESFDFFTKAVEAFRDNNGVEAVRALCKERLVNVNIRHTGVLSRLARSIPALLTFLKILKNETAAYLWGQEFLDCSEMWLIGEKWKDVCDILNHDQLFHYLQGLFYSLQAELDRLKKLGYKPRPLALKVLTSHSIEEAIIRLKILG